MSPVETVSNPSETGSDISARLDAIEAMLAHLQDHVHEVARFIDEHKPALARGLALLDPGNGVRRFLGGKRA